VLFGGEGKLEGKSSLAKGGKEGLPCQKEGKNCLAKTKGGKELPCQKEGKNCLAKRSQRLALP
jgi:hypothetical protein